MIHKGNVCTNRHAYTCIHIMYMYVCTMCITMYMNQCSHVCVCVCVYVLGDTVETPNKDTLGTIKYQLFFSFM